MLCEINFKKSLPLLGKYKYNKYKATLKPLKGTQSGDIYLFI